VLAEVIRNLAIALQPFTPVAAGKLLDQVAVAQDARDFTFMGATHALAQGTQLPAPQGVFPRIVDEEEAKEKTA
jgi:methionyl-tRNA synthetase